MSNDRQVPRIKKIPSSRICRRSMSGRALGRPRPHRGRRRRRRASSRKPGAAGPAGGRTLLGDVSWPVRGGPWRPTSSRCASLKSRNGSGTKKPWRDQDLCRAISFIKRSGGDSPTGGSRPTSIARTRTCPGAQVQGLLPVPQLPAGADISGGSIVIRHDVHQPCTEFKSLSATRSHCRPMAVEMRRERELGE